MTPAPSTSVPLNPRRRFLQTSMGVVVGTALLAGSTWWWYGQQAAEAVLSSGLGIAADGVLRELHGFSQIGALARAEHSEFQASLTQLSQQLATRLAWQPEAGAEQFQQALAAAVRADFDAQRLRSVAGWQLSETEVLVAALRSHLISAEQEQAENSTQATTAHPGRVAQFSNWGPQQTRAGEVPNRQSDGAGAFWFDSPDVPRWAEIALDGERLHTEYRGYVIVAALKDELLEKVIASPGEHVFTVHDDMNQRWQEIGRFTVLPALSAEHKLSTTLCQITGWGPRETVAGTVPNRQSDGSMGVWVETLCAPSSTKLRVGSQTFNAHYNGQVLTALVPQDLLQQPGSLALALFDEAENTHYPVGDFLIAAP